MFRWSWEALGTKWIINIYPHETLSKNQFNQKFQETQTIITQFVLEFENQYSRFKSQSLIGILNKEKKLTNPNDDLLDMLKMCHKAWELSQGYFDIRIANILENLGYGSNLTDQEEISKVKILENQQFIQYNPEEISIKPEEKIDLGAVGKGFLVDKVVVKMQEMGWKYFWINAGGDIWSTSNEKQEPVSFWLENNQTNQTNQTNRSNNRDNSQNHYTNLSQESNPSNPLSTKYLGKIELKNQAIACSSGNKRKWFNGKEEFHHLINPKTGKSIDHIQSVFVSSESTAWADLASTLLFVTPPNTIWQIYKQLPIEFMLVFKNQESLRSPNYQAEVFS